MLRPARFLEQGFGFRGQDDFGFGFGVSGFGCQVSGVGFLGVSGFGLSLIFLMSILVSGFRF